VIDQALALGLPVMAFAPSASVSTRSHEITTWNLQPIRSALAHGLIPLVYGDVVTDSELGGTILSTEELFAHLALEFKPERLLFAGLEAGVFADYPANTQLISHISPDQPLTEQVGASGSIDVTGGMRSKVALLQRICQTVPGAHALIFSGVSAPNLGRALSGENLGTSIY
jgi:isopentenyl phosphate kinase